ncbi:MAG TPA: DNA polymerase III subunit gamma/tau [Candidatus Eisenbacteria bacterium]|nr:DNA polymerase III subunit gamma/tau [Candidatus Eisenbacteria bacterium]
MPHLALARKYRPQRFRDLIGQEPIRLTLERAVATDRVAHAYLFSGPRGSGKTTTARLLAKALNCERRKPGESEPCNECGSCREITSGTSLDVLEIDGASNRGIEEIRNLRENVKYAASGGKSKVYIIDEAHQLTDFAWNALLKTLEEPPAHVRFVFATTEPLEVPDTIASRCQVFEFRRLKSEELARHLEGVAKAEEVKLDPDAAALIARASEGAVRDALSRLDQALAVSPDGITAAVVAQVLGLAGLEAYFDLGAAIAARDAKAALETLDRLHDAGMDVEELADGLTHHLRQLLLLAVDPSLDKMIDAAPADRERYAAQAKGFRAGDLSAMLGRLIEFRAQLRRAEAPRVLLEVCLVELCTMPMTSDVSDLIQRLHDLESRLGGGTAGPRQAPAAGRAPSAPSRPPGPPRREATGGFEASAGGSAPRTAEPPRSEPPRSAPRREEPPRDEPSREEPRRPMMVDPVAPPSADLAADEPSLADSALAARWREIVDRVKERKLLLGTCLEEGLFLGVQGSSVRVALTAEHSFHRAMLEMKENKDILNQEFERTYGPGATLLCVGSDQAVTGAGIRPAPREATQAAPAPSGLVQRIVELFDGEILGQGPEGSGAT